MPIELPHTPDIDRSLRSRNLRIVAGFFSYGTWKVALASAHDERFSGAHHDLQRALEMAVADCDLKREVRETVKP